MAIDIKLPHLGENIETGVVVKIFVKAGDRVEKNQNVLELETEKASIEVPVEVSGTVKKIHVREGESIAVNEVFITLAETVNNRSSIEKVDKPIEKDMQGTLPEKNGSSTKEQTIAQSDDHVIESQKLKQLKEVSTQSLGTAIVVPASPSTRRFAREIGIEITQVPGSGPGRRISIEDVKAYSKKLNRSSVSSSSLDITKPLPNFARWGETRVESLSNVRSKTAENLSYAWSAIPHVTQFDKADITELEQQRKKFSQLAKNVDTKLTLTAILLKVVVGALKNFPQFNASIDVLNNSVVYKEFYHIGVAVDTDRGLIVPIIRDVNKKNIIELSRELTEVADKARRKKTSIEDMEGGTFTVSNLGGIGGTSFTPIVKWPEVAILGIARSKTEAVYLNGEFVPRLMLPLVLSYDHRIIDGADGARFLRWIVTALENPLMIALNS